MDAGIRRAASRLEQRRWPQRRGKKRARDGDESAIWLGRDQHREPLRRLRRETRSREADAGPRRRERIEIFLIVEKSDVGRLRAIERRDVTNAPVQRSVRP